MNETMLDIKIEYGFVAPNLDMKIYCQEFHMEYLRSRTRTRAHQDKHMKARTSTPKKSTKGGASLRVLTNALRPAC